MIGRRAFKNAAPQLERELGISRTEAALLAVGIDCDAVEWDWPRWGRRLVLSGPWPKTYRGNIFPQIVVWPPGYPHG